MFRLALLFVCISFIALNYFQQHKGNMVLR